MKYKRALSGAAAAAILFGIAGNAALADDALIKITADFAFDGRLISVLSEPVSEAGSAVGSDTHKIFYWDSLSGMKPFEAAPAETAPPSSTEIPSQTAAPSETDAPSQTDTPLDADYTFVFGGASDGSVTVDKDDIYGAKQNGMTYGLYGIEGAPDVSDGRTDGFKSTASDPYTVLKSGTINGKPYLSADYGSYSDDTLANMAGGVMPVRFSVEAEEHRYYTVSATVVNTSSEEDAEVTLYSEKRHAILSGKKLAPGESITKTWNVNLESVYYNAGGIRNDDQINVCVVGRNAGLSSVSVKKHDSFGKTIWLCTDSTGCDQPAEIPYFPLRNYSGTGSLLAKYINPEIAISNQGEGGLTAADNNHFNNAVAHMNKGDYLYVQYGLNDRGAGTAKFKENLEKYYTAAKQKDVSLILVSPSDRRSSWDSASKKWQSVAAPFAEAAREFVEDKIANDNAQNIAYIDLNTNFIDWMNDVEEQVLSQRQRLGFGDTEVDERAIIYYYLADRQSGVDSIHINDYGTDNAAYMVMREAKSIVDSANSDNTDESQKRQARVLSGLVENMGTDAPSVVSDEIVAAGWPMNSFYPYPSSAEVSYQYPSIVKGVSVDGGVLRSMTVMVQGSANKYFQGCADILDADGNTVATAYTVSTSVNPSIGHIDNTSAKYGDIVTMYFDSAVIPEGGSYRAYVKGKENGAELPDDELYSSVYNEPENTAEYLIAAADGSSADCFEYAAENESIVGKGADNAAKANNWVFAGSTGDKRYTAAAKDDVNGAVFAQNGSGTFSLCKYFNGYRQISEGKLRLHFRINYILGSFTIKLPQTGKIASWLDGIEAVRIADGEVFLPDGASAGKLKTGKWTDIDVTLDIDRGIEELSIAGGDGVSCDIAKLQTSSWSDTEKLLPIKGFAVTATENPSTIPTYPFEFYLSELLVTTVETASPTVGIYAQSESIEKGIAEGGGEVRINSDVTLTATENEGYAFTGWYDGDKLYSRDNPLMLEKVRSDISLTAVFEIQKSKEAAASFEISPDKSAVRRDSELILSVVNARDADGNKVSGLEVSDIDWSCDEAGVMIDNGVVSVDDSFEIDSNTKKTVTVHGSFNSAESSVDITVYSYACYEVMSEKTAFTGRIVSIASSDCIVFPSSGSAVYTLSDTVSLDTVTTIILSNAWSGSNTSGNNRTLEFLDESSNAAFSITYSWNGIKVNGEELTNTVFKNSFNTITITADPSNDSITVEAAASDGTVKSASAPLDGSSLAAIRFTTSGNIPTDRLLGISDITVMQ